MSPYDHWPDGAVFDGSDIFREARPLPRDNDASYLQPGQTEWFGPMPLDFDGGYGLRRHCEDLQQRAIDAARKGVHLHIQAAGAYIRTHRLREGPTKKLSDWKQLPSGVPMLLNPLPTAADVERAISRVRYMKLHGFGRYQSWTDDAGALWVERS